MAPLRTGACVEKLVISEYFTDCSSVYIAAHTFSFLSLKIGVFSFWKSYFVTRVWVHGGVDPLFHCTHSYSSAKTNRILTRSVITLKTVVQNSWASLQCYWTALDLVSITVCRALGALFSQPFYVLKTGGLQLLPMYFLAWEQGAAQFPPSPHLPLSSQVFVSHVPSPAGAGAVNPAWLPWGQLCAMETSMFA